MCNRILLLAAGFLLFAPLQASGLGEGKIKQADIPCNCRVPGGKKLPVGTETCLRWQGKMVRARCEKVLNNTSWTILSEGCDLS